jgi:hypothetical protein
MIMLPIVPHLGLGFGQKSASFTNQLTHCEADGANGGVPGSSDIPVADYKSAKRQSDPISNR